MKLKKLPIRLQTFLKTTSLMVFIQTYSYFMRGVSADELSPCIPILLWFTSALARTRALTTPVEFVSMALYRGLQPVDRSNYDRFILSNKTGTSLRISTWDATKHCSLGYIWMSYLMKIALQWNKKSRESKRFFVVYWTSLCSWKTIIDLRDFAMNVFTLLSSK